MITRLFALVLVALISHSASADIVFTNIQPGNFGTGVTGVERLATVIDFAAPGTYDVKSIDAKLNFTLGTHNNLSAIVTLFTNPDINNTTSVFQNQVAQATFQLGNVNITPGSGGMRLFNLDFAAQNMVTRFTDNMGIDIQVFQNGVVNSGIGFGLVNVGNGNSKMFYDDDQNGLFAAFERGILSSQFDNQLQVNGFAVTAVPEPSGFTLLGLLFAFPIARGRIRK